MDRVILLLLTLATSALAATNGSVEILRSPSRVKVFRPEPRDSPLVLSSTVSTPLHPTTEDPTQPGETTIQPSALNLTDSCERLDYEDWAAAVFRLPAGPQDPALLVFNSSYETPFSMQLEQEQLAGLMLLNRTSVNCTDYVDELSTRISAGARASLVG